VFLRLDRLLPQISGSFPIDLRVVVLEPGIAENYALLSEAKDSEECPFEIGLITEDYIYHFRDLTCFVERAVYVVHQYRAKDAPDANTLCMDKVFVYKAAHSSGVQKCLDGMHLASVSGTDLDRKDDGHSASIKGVGILTSFTFNTANLFTNSNWNTLFASCTKQNPPLGQSIFPLPLLHSSELSSLQLIPPFVLQLIFGRPSSGSSPSQDGWPLHTSSTLVEARSTLL